MPKVFIKYWLLIFIAINCISCDEYWPNSYQVNKTMEHLACYKSLMVQIVHNSATQQKLLEIRKFSGSRLTFEKDVDEEYRLIEPHELEQVFPTWMADCREMLEKEKDFKGIRYLDNGTLIIEVARFERNVSYSAQNLRERHYLLLQKGKIDRSKFYQKSEKRKWEKQLDDNLIYEVSHIKY